MDIIISADNNAQIITIPILPTNMPELIQNFKHETFTTINSELNLIGNKSLQTVSFSSFFPHLQYDFARAYFPIDYYINFFTKYTDEKKPFRMILLGHNDTLISNLAYTINDFNYYLDRVGDAQYTINMTEYRFLN